MTEDTFRIATNLIKDIEHLNQKREQILDFDRKLKKGKPTDQEINTFLNSMINVVDALSNIKKEQFKNL